MYFVPRVCIQYGTTELNESLIHTARYHLHHCSDRRLVIRFSSLHSLRSGRTLPLCGDVVPAADKSKWVISGWLRLARSVATSALIFVSLIQATKLRHNDLSQRYQVPAVEIVPLAYGKPIVIPRNIIKCNLMILFRTKLLA